MAQLPPEPIRTDDSILLPDRTALTSPSEQIESLHTQASSPRLMMTESLHPADPGCHDPAFHAAKQEKLIRLTNPNSFDLTPRWGVTQDTNGLKPLKTRRRQAYVGQIYVNY